MPRALAASALSLSQAGGSSAARPRPRPVVAPWSTCAASSIYTRSMRTVVGTRGLSLSQGAPRRAPVAFRKPRTAAIGGCVAPSQATMCESVPLHLCPQALRRRSL